MYLMYVCALLRVNACMHVRVCVCCIDQSTDSFPPCSRLCRATLLAPKTFNIKLQFPPKRNYLRQFPLSHLLLPACLLKRSLWLYLTPQASPGEHLHLRLLTWHLSCGYIHSFWRSGQRHLGGGYYSASHTLQKVSSEHQEGHLLTKQSPPSLKGMSSSHLGEAEGDSQRVVMLRWAGPSPESLHILLWVWGGPKSQNTANDFHPRAAHWGRAHKALLVGYQAHSTLNLRSLSITTKLVINDITQHSQRIIIVNMHYAPPQKAGYASSTNHVLGRYSWLLKFTKDKFF